MRLSRRPALLPPEGEEKEKREALEPGRHNVKFEFPGFSPLEVPNVLVLVGQSLKVDARMMVGGLTQTVEVTENVPLIASQSTLVAHNITSEEFDRLPKARSFQGMLVTSPSVISGQDQFGMKAVLFLAFPAFNFGCPFWWGHCRKNVLASIL